MTVGLLDLSIVTDQLLAQLRLARATTRLWTEEPTPPTGTPDDEGIPIGDTTPQTPFDIVFTGMPPDAARNLAGQCKVSLYLFHVQPDKFYRNTYPADTRDTSRAAQRPRQGAEQPLALTLFYLLSAHSESYIEEQQAMSIALKAFHDQAIVTATVPLHSRKQELTVTMEPQSIDEIGRLWQATTTALRLSAVYRASVVFLEPEVRLGPAVRPVEKYTVAAYPEFLVTRTIITPSGLVTVWGQKFNDASLEVRVDDVLQTATTATSPAAGSFHVVEPARLDLQLPSGMRAGNHRLGVKIAGEPVEAVFTLKLTADVP